MPVADMDHDPRTETRYWSTQTFLSGRARPRPNRIWFRAARATLILECIMSLGGDWGSIDGIAIRLLLFAAFFWQCANLLFATAIAAAIGFCVGFEMGVLRVPIGEADLPLLCRTPWIFACLAAPVGFAYSVWTNIREDD
jgi:hypothetical protein